jgi:hypothetical protein
MGVSCTSLVNDRGVGRRTQEALACARVADGLKNGSVAVDSGCEGGEREEGCRSVHSWVWLKVYDARSA